MTVAPDRIAALKAIAQAHNPELDGPSFCQYDTDACPACGRLHGTCRLPYGKNTMAKLFKAMRDRSTPAAKSPSNPQKR